MRISVEWPLDAALLNQTMSKSRKQKSEETVLTWEILNYAPAPLDTYAGSAILVGDRIYVAKRYYLAALLCKDGTWLNYTLYIKSIGTLNLSSGHVAELAEDKIYYFGGGKFNGLVEVDIVLLKRMDDPSIDLEYTVREVEMFNQGPSARAYMSSVFAEWRNLIITFGGRNRRTKQFSNDVHALDLETKAWTKLVLRGEAPLPRSAHAAMLLGTTMYIYGGFIADNYLGDLWIAELGNQCAPYWSMVKTVGPSPPPRIFARLNNLNGVLILFGGFEQKHRELQVYVPKENEWDDGSGPNITITNASLIEEDEYMSVTTPQGILYFAYGTKHCLLREDIA